MRVDVLGVRVDALDVNGLLDRVKTFARDGVNRLVMYVNTDCVLRARQDAAYRRILNRADLVYADGVGVVWAARMFGPRLSGRMTAADFMPRFGETFAGAGMRLFLLGGRAGVAERAARSLQRRAPGLGIVGTHHGYLDPEDTAKVVEMVNCAAPDVLLVGFGVPHQEKWIEENAHLLAVPVIWGVGGLFDFLSGRTRRGPQWLLDHGFEWLCRLAAEPRRLWRRYLIGNCVFVSLVVRTKLSGTARGLLRRLSHGPWCRRRVPWREH